jgi:four helix bundle protein
MNNVKISDNIILNLSFNFSLDIIAFSEILEEQKKYVVARQLLRSGTSIGANIKEAQSAESNVDFIHKLKIADKEADETGYWLLLCKHAPTYPTSLELLERHTELKKILGKIIANSKGRSSGEGHRHIHG